MRAGDAWIEKLAMLIHLTMMRSVSLIRCLPKMSPSSSTTTMVHRLPPGGRGGAGRGVRGSGPPQPRPGPLTGYVQIRRVFFSGGGVPPREVRNC